jgi:hypothetical protein
LKFLASTLILFATLAACSSSGDDSGSSTCTEVPVFNSSFADYHSWTNYSFDGPTIAGSPHTSGPRREYLNQKPPHGSTSFPVGTIIVKEIGAPPASGDSVFAMVKVGCDYNSAGAENWEWYELQVDATGTASILWDGPVPPAGMSYSGDPTACNTCHSAAKANDYVQAPSPCPSTGCPLALSSF